MSEKKDKFYYKDGTTLSRLDYGKVLHRVGGPAIEWASGERWWYVDGKRHRIDGPALEWDDGGKEWYVDGKLHRVDGPAMEYSDGERWWYVDGMNYSKQNFNKLIKQVNEMSVAMKLTDPRWWVRELGENKVKLVG